MQIETERLLLREFSIEDAPGLFYVLSDEDVMRHVEPVFSFDKTKEFVQKYGICSKPRIYALVKKDTNAVIGHMVFHSYDEEEIYEIGWILGKAHWRQGYAYEISKALLAYGFHHLNLHKIVAQTDDPVKSLGLMKKLGMSVEAVLRKQSKYPFDRWEDLYICGILKEEFETSHKSQEQEPLC